ATRAGASAALHGVHMTGTCTLPDNSRTETCGFTLAGQTLGAVDSWTGGGWRRRYSDGRSVDIGVAGGRPVPVPIAGGRGAAVRLAHLFAGAVGLDPDPAMIAEGYRAAQERDIANITWIQARAEDLPAVAPGPYRLVTFGQSFYWTDEVPVAEAVYDMLEPGGAL